MTINSKMLDQVINKIKTCGFTPQHIAFHSNATNKMSIETSFNDKIFQGKDLMFVCPNGRGLITISQKITFNVSGPKSGHAGSVLIQTDMLNVAEGSLSIIAKIGEGYKGADTQKLVLIGIRKIFGEENIIYNGGSIVQEN